MLIKELYAAEIDRKDKILSSLGIVSTPTTLLIGATTYLINTVVMNTKYYVHLPLDVAVILFYVSTGVAVYYIAKVFWNFHRILDGGAYAYVPDASQVLQTLLAVKRYTDSADIYIPDRVKSEARERFVPLYAEAARLNCITNDQRLGRRRSLFRSTSFALLATLTAVVAVAIHRQWPQIYAWHSSGTMTHDQPEHATTIPTAASGHTGGGNSTAPGDSLSPAHH